MLCALLGLLHTYSAIGSTFRVWGTPNKQPVGVSVESNRHRMTIVHNESFRPCFTSDLKPVWLSTTMAKYVSPAADHYVLYPNPNPDAKLPCDDEDEDDDDEEDDEEDEEEDEEEKSDVPTRSPSRPPSRPPITRASLGAITKRVEILRHRSDLLRSRMANITNRLHGATNPRKLIVLLRDLHRLIREKAQTRRKLTQATLQRFAARQRNFASSPDGKEAKAFCESLGAKGHAMKGCMQDMRLTGDPVVAKAAVLATLAASRVAPKVVAPKVVAPRVVAPTASKPAVSKVRSVSSVISPKPVVPKPTPISPKLGQAAIAGPFRTCSASGDPHFTNFNGEYFHIQENAIYVLAKTDDGLFEVQVKQAGSSGAGSPSYVVGVVAKYADQTFRSSFRRDGFSVQVGPSSVSVTVPGAYVNRMLGICGSDGPSPGPHNFKLPSGTIADVNYGKKNWGLAGYGGPATKLSLWHLSWRPTVSQCLFPPAECLSNLRPRSPSVKRFISTPWGVIDTKTL